MNLSRWNVASLLLTLLGSWLIPIQARATVATVAWYRLGENDSGAASGLLVNSTTLDFAGSRHLQRYGTPIYAELVASNATRAVGSSLAVQFDGSSQYLSNAVVTAARNNVGLEAWVRADSVTSGLHIIAYNGSTSGDGWGLHRNGSSFGVLFAGVATFGSVPVVTGQWVHLAWVRDNGTSTLYVNGSPVATSSSTPQVPTAGFALGTRPEFPASAFFGGAIDEVRVFTFTAGRFSPDDLLLNRQRILTLPASNIMANGATLNGNATPYGFETAAWFEWGATTNYENATLPQPGGSGFAGTNFSQPLTSLPLGATIHYRALSSNILGVACGADQVFRTLGPSATTLPATLVTPSSAILHGQANAGDEPTVCWFEWGTNGFFPNTTSPQAIGSGGGDTNFSEGILGLPDGPACYFRAVASNSFGIVRGRSLGFASKTSCFDFDNGQVPPNAALFGDATISTTNGVGNSGVLKLTVNQTAQMGSLILEALDPGVVVTDLEVRFDLRIGNDGGSHADGMSFVWSPTLTNTAFGEEYHGGLMQEAAGSLQPGGLAVSFDTINFGPDPEDPAPGVDILLGGTTIARFDHDTYFPFLPPDFLITGASFVPVVISVSSNGILSVIHNNVVLVSNFQLPGFTGYRNARFGWGARTGGYADNHFVDNLCITSVTANPAPQIAMLATGTNALVAFTGDLQSAPAPAGPWSDLAGAASPQVVSTSGQQYFRAVSRPSPSTGWTWQQNPKGIAALNWSNAPGTIQDNGATPMPIVNPPTASRVLRRSKP